jgi:hypothetical protein
MCNDAIPEDLSPWEIDAPSKAKLTNLEATELAIVEDLIHSTSSSSD